MTIAFSDFPQSHRASRTAPPFFKSPELGEGMQASQCRRAAMSEESRSVGIVDIKTTS